MIDASERRIVAAVKDGRLEIDQSNKALFRRFLRAFDGGEVDVVIRKHVRRRSLNQNAWIWGYAYPLLAEFLGYDHHEHDDLHYALVAKCFGDHFDKRVGAMVPNQRSSQMTTAQFGEYMDWLVRFAAQYCGGMVIELPGENGLSIPEPNEAVSA